MTLEEQYTRILEKEKEKELISFFKSITADERRSLAPLVKKLAKEYFAFGQHGSTWRRKATDRQRNMLSYSFIASYNKKEIEKENPSWLLTRDHLEKILDWYVPSWLGEYINSFADRGWMPLDYGYLVELEQRGFIQASPQLVARLLVSFAYEPERLLQYPVTLKEHVWYLFQYETSINFSNRFHYFEGGKVEKSWLDFFLLYVESGKLPRQPLLKEALLASNRNFNKNLSSWFAELFLQLKPTIQETLSLQAELFNLFSSPHSKVVNTALQTCKTIVEEPSFNMADFLDGVSLLLSSSTKSVVVSTLQLLEKLAKKNMERRLVICQLATGALVHKDEILQSRAAKLIQKFDDKKDEDLRQTILLYKDSLFSNAKALLQPYLHSDDSPEMAKEQPAEHTRKEPKGRLTEATALPAIHDIDELIFLTAQAFDNNESWHMDALPAALMRLQHQVRGGHLQKMEPAIQRAIRLYSGERRAGQGELDYLLACFFLDYGLWLIEQYPEEAHTARELYHGYLSRSDENKKIWKEHGTRTTFLGSWKPERGLLLYSAYYKLLNYALLGVKNRSNLPLLCEPTHAPGWIDPSVLVERLFLYQQQGIRPDDTDLQVALSRCWLHGTKVAMMMAAEKLQGELRELMLFMLEPSRQPAGPFNSETAWMAAALGKSPLTVYPALAELAYSSRLREFYTGQYPYEIVAETYTYNHHQWDGKKTLTIKKTAQREIIRFDLSAQQVQKPKEISGLKKFFNKLTGREEQEVPELPPLIYEYLRIRERWLDAEDRDVRRLFLLTPNNPEPLLAFTVEKCLSNPELFGEIAKRFTTRVLEVLLETWHPMGEMAHLFVATCLLSPDKTAATYAAELWLRGVEEESINSCLLGTILGKHLRIEFAPPKRFSDLVVKSLLNISPAHNRELELLLTSLLKELPATPVKGLNKMLKIYFELLSLNASVVKEEKVKERLRQWKENSGLNRVLKAAV